MKIHQDRCPNCSKLFCFPIDYPGGLFRTICPACHRGYDLLAVQVDEELLAWRLSDYHTASWIQKLEMSKRLFQYLRSIAVEFRFVSPAHPNAVLFLIGETRSTFPIATYFQDTYHLVRQLNRFLFSASLAAIGAIILLEIGLSLIPVLIGTTGAMLCFWQFIALPKIKGVKRNRLLDEQFHLKQCYNFGQNLNRIYQIKNSHQNQLQRQQSVVEQMIHNPQLYLTQIELYQRAIKCTQYYLDLCDRAIEKYEVAIRATTIQIETSKLSSDLASNLTDLAIERELEQLEDQLACSVPPNFCDHDSNDDPTS